MLSAVLLSGSERFMLVHNHPGGDLKPSNADLDLNDAVMKAANVTGLFYEDHYILTPRGHWYSFVDNDLILPADYTKA